MMLGSSVIITNKNIFEKIKCDIGLMIDCDVVEKKELKQGRNVLNTHDHRSLFNVPPSDHTQRPHLLATCSDHTH